MKIAASIILAALSGISSLHGQSDAQAIRILDSFSAKATKAPSVAMVFRMISTDLTENSSDTLNGSVIISGDKYRLDLEENTVWYDGETNWNYLNAEKEVTITRPDKKDHSFQNRPSEIFSMYKTGYKCRLTDEKQDSFIIDLFPEDISGDMIRVRVEIRKSDLNLISLEYKRRDDLVIDLQISEYDLKQKPDPGAFVFQKGKYKGVEINDMR
jgi:outer membrane lipoprotein-sorting protein